MSFPMGLGAWGARFALVLALVCLGLSGAARSESARPLIVGSETGFPPYTDADAEGRPTGFAVELFAAVAAVMDIPVRFRLDKWDTVWQGLMAGEIDALPLVAQTDERKGQVEFTRPYAIGYDSFFVRKDRPPIHSIGQARGLSVIVLRSDVSHHALAGRGFTHQLAIVDSLPDGFRLLASGRHDAMLAPRLPGERLVEASGLRGAVEAGPLLKDYRRELCFAVRKGGTELRDRLEQGLAIVKANGEYDRLYGKWLGLYETPAFPVKYAAWGAAIIVALLALLCLWTWQLRRQVALRTEELARAVAAVRSERQRLHDVLQALPVYVVLLTQDYRVAFANRFFEQRYGKALGRRCYDYLFNRGEPCERCETFKALKANRPADWEWTGPDGHEYRIHDFPFTDMDGSPMIMEVGIDVTEMNRAKRSLRDANASLERRVAERTAELEAARREAEEARDLLRVTMDNAPALMSYIDADCRFRRVNRAYEQWFGHGCEEVYGRHLREILGEAAWQSFAPYVEQALAGERVAFEIPVFFAEGGTRWIHATYSPDRDAEGQIRGCVAHVLDITERKLAEEGLRQADRRKDEFLAMLAHELRNPLAPIRNAVQIMRRLETADPKLQWARDVIDRQVDHLTRLVDDLLDVSRISRGKIELKKEPLALADIVQRAVETSRPLIDARRHRFAVRLPTEPVHVEGDLVRLAQAVSNLLNNAAKYTDEGGQIELAVEPSENDVVIRVRDTGRGIDPAQALNLFDLFYQVDRTLDRAEGGLGIGLSLVKRLVAMHGGEVWAVSEGRGKGSEFVIRLPRLQEHSTLHPPFRPDRDRRAAGSAS
ncbi:transporter substrate-binding domain-containing protein [Methylocaldum sp. MU1018]